MDLSGESRAGASGRVDVARLRPAAGRCSPRAGARGHGRHAAGLRSPVRAVAIGLAVAAVLAAAVAAGVRWADATAAPGPLPVRAVAPRPAGQPSETDWAALLRELDRRRSAAFASGDQDALTGVYLPGSAARERDAATLGALAARGLAARGLRLEVRSVMVAQVRQGRVVLHVADRLAAYDIVDRAGRAVDRHPGRGELAWAVTLVPAPGAQGEWRIAEIVPGDQ